MSGSASRISLQEAQGIPDILSGENFRLQLAELPNSVGDTAALEIKCQSAIIVGRQNQHYEVPLGGFIRTFRGRNRFGQNMFAVTFVEDITLDTWKKLYGWLEAIDGTDSGTSIGNIADYSVDAELTIFDQANNPIDVHTYYNTYIVGISDIQLEVQQSQPIMIQAEFCFDYRYSNAVSTR